MSRIVFDAPEEISDIEAEDIHYRSDRDVWEVVVQQRANGDKVIRQIPRERVYFIDTDRRTFD